MHDGVPERSDEMVAYSNFHLKDSGSSQIFLDISFYSKYVFGG